jgi:hypothetical protein
LIPISISLIIPIVTLIAVFGTLLLLLIVILKRKDIKRIFYKHKIIYSILLILIFLCDLLFIYGFYSFQQSSADSKIKSKIKASREKFILKVDRPYGEFTMPKGTYIERYDPFDNGGKYRTFRLTGLRYAKFPNPTKIAGIWASSYSSIGRLELSKDQLIDGKLCKKNQVALFRVPSIEYDIVKEFGKERPSGINARFKPSQWTFFECLKERN